MRSWMAPSMVIAFLAAGCGEVGPVAVVGDVTIDGQPVGVGSPGTIRFQPADPTSGRAAEGFIKDGRYEATVFPGRYDVLISWEKWPDKAATRGQKPPPGFDEIPPMQMLPAKCTKPGLLTAEVAADKAQIDFPLTSK